MVKQVGPFELGKCVGKGATASVYLAYEPIRRKDVAIKQLKHSENSRRTIQHEVLRAARPCSVVSVPTRPGPEPLMARCSTCCCPH
jgi:serine/threonine protein kinase